MPQDPALTDSAPWAIPSATDLPEPPPAEAVPGASHRIDGVLAVHGPWIPAAADWPLVIDSPHSGRQRPPDFDTLLTDAELRELEDCYIDALYRPATAHGVPLLAAIYPRLYLDANRHADDVDPAMLDGDWPRPLRHSGKGATGKSLLWRLVDEGRPVYAGRLPVAQVQARIDRCLIPYQQALKGLLDAAHARHGAVWHINAHSMGEWTHPSVEGVAGQPRPDVILGDRDGSTCEPAFTAFVADFLRARGYGVQINHPFKGVELVRAYADPAAGRHSLQIELNRRLYMDSVAMRPNAGYERLQADLLALVQALGPWAMARRPVTRP